MLYGEALTKIRAAAKARGLLPEETVPLSAAVGRVTSRALVSVDPVPPFDNSSMDGFALAAAKAAKVPARLTVLGTILAGDKPRCAVETGGAWRIMTGAPMPAGCDAVVPVEKTREQGGQVEVLEAAESGDFVRGAGRDFPAGGEVCPAGTRLGARHLLALAAVGLSEIPVRRKPRVALISTGRELVAPGNALKAGQIRDASSTYLSAAIPALGCEYSFAGIVADDPADFRKRLKRVMMDGVDVVLTTGAVSMGISDFIPSALKELGAEPVLHKVMIRPGKPVFVANLPKGPLFVGLPGNPVSTVVGLRFFVEPLLRELTGRPAEPRLRSALKSPVDKPEGLRCFFKAKRHDDGFVEILPGQASFQIHSLLSADCWAVLPEDGEHLPAGTKIDTYPLSESLS
jgi:molybdopterin molybdotransferase